MTRLARFALIIGLALASVPAMAQEHRPGSAPVATIEILVPVSHGRKRTASGPRVKFVPSARS